MLQHRLGAGAQDAGKPLPSVLAVVCFSQGNPLRAQLYEPFYADFGPLNLGHAFKYCRRTAELLQVSHPSPFGQAPALKLPRLLDLPVALLCQQTHYWKATGELRPGACAPQDAARLGKKLLFYTGPSPQHKANAAVLVRLRPWAAC